MLRRNAESGKPAAIRFLGSSYVDGSYGLVPSHKKAARLFQRAAGLGDVLAMFNLGCLYKQGDGVKLDKKKMVRYWRVAADGGFANAQDNLGLCYQEANGVAKDYAEAKRFYKLAADQGFTNAEVNLACLCFLGEDPEDGAEAARVLVPVLERAAAKGHEDARAVLDRLSRGGDFTC